MMEREGWSGSQCLPLFLGDRRGDGVELLKGKKEKKRKRKKKQLT